MYRLELEADRSTRIGDPRLRRSVERGDPVDAVGGKDRHENLDAAARRHDRRHATKGHRVQAEDATEQRAPGHGDRHERRDLGQRPREGLGRLDQEDRVAGITVASTPGGTTGRLGHAGGVGVDPEDEGARIGGRASQHRPAVTRAEIDGHPVGPGDPLVELADVDVDDAPADDLLHAGDSTGGALSRNDVTPVIRGSALLYVWRDRAVHTFGTASDDAGGLAGDPPPIEGGNPMDTTRNQHSHDDTAPENEEGGREAIGAGAGALGGAAVGMAVGGPPGAVVGGAIGAAGGAIAGEASEGDDEAGSGTGAVGGGVAGAALGGAFGGPPGAVIGGAVGAGAGARGGDQVEEEIEETEGTIRR